MEALQSLLKNLMLKLVYSQSKPVCGLQEKQAQCDTTNLGCLLQTFPYLCDSRVTNASSSTVMSTANKILQAYTYGSELTFHERNRSYNRGDHASCGIGKKLTPEVTAIVESVEGLLLDHFLQT